MSEVEYVVEALFDVMTVDIRREMRELRQEVATLKAQKEQAAEVRQEEVRVSAKQERMLNQTQAAKFLGCSREFIRRKRREGSFPEPIRISTRGLRWPQSELERWARAQDPEAADKETT